MRFIQEDHADPVPIHSCLRSLSQVWVIIRLDGRARHTPPFGWSGLGVNIDMHLSRVGLFSQQGEHRLIEKAAIVGFALFPVRAVDGVVRLRCWNTYKGS
jgi:hypothetical protein